ncbi:hypothetical protein, partial [uncultured Sulfitobacter sp.]|uniref:hypothetical protein n=1 Tax=uncultured Sulfitobacter sp. TaxID=191468 RepID=UPI002593CBAB
LPPETRKNVLHEIASNSGFDGLDLATAIARSDSDPEVKATVVDALSFRRADRHIPDLLKGAGDATYDILAPKGHLEDIAADAVATMEAGIVYHPGAARYWKEAMGN